MSDFSGNIYNFTPDGTRSTFASGLDNPTGPAFDGAGDLFESDYGPGGLTGNIYEFTPGGVQSTFATGLNNPTYIAIQGVSLPVPEPSALGLLTISAIALLVHRRRNLPCCRVIYCRTARDEGSGIF